MNYRQPKTVAIVTTVVLSVVTSLVVNMVTDHFSWPLMIVLIVVTLLSIGAQLWLTRPTMTARTSQSTVSTGPAVPLSIPSHHSWLRRTINAVLVIVFVIAPGVAGFIYYLTDPVSVTVKVGARPDRIAITTNGRRAYVTNSQSDTVSVIETASNTLIATVPVGGSPHDVVISRDDRHAYVLNSAAGTISVIDTGSNTVVDTIPVGKRPSGLAITPDNRRAYVTNYGTNTVNVVNINDKTVETIRVAEDRNPVENGLRFSEGTTNVAITPDGRHAYITISTGTYNSVGSVAVVDTTSDTVKATIPDVKAPGSVAISTDGRHAYISNTTRDRTGKVSVFNTASNTFTTDISVDATPGDVVTSPRGNHVYVFTYNPNRIVMVDTATNTVADTINPRVYSHSGAITSDERHIYITNYFDNVVSMINNDVN